MAAIRRFSHGRRRLGWTVLGGCLVLVLTAAPACAELSSVDAYGGQAQVLGKPVHHHRAAEGRSTGTQGSRRAGGQSTGATGSQAGVGSAESSSGSGSYATPGSSSGAPTTPSGSNSAPGASASNDAGGGIGSGVGSRDGAAATAAGTGGSGASGGGQSPPIAAANVADVSNGSLSLSALDVLLLVAVFIALAGVGVLIRRSSRQSE